MRVTATLVLSGLTALCSATFHASAETAAGIDALASAWVTAVEECRSIVEDGDSAFALTSAELQFGDPSNSTGSLQYVLQDAPIEILIWIENDGVPTVCEVTIGSVDAAPALTVARLSSLFVERRNSLLNSLSHVELDLNVEMPVGFNVIGYQTPQAQCHATTLLILSDDGERHPFVKTTLARGCDALSD